MFAGTLDVQKERFYDKFATNEIKNEQKSSVNEYLVFVAGYFEFMDVSQIIL